MADISPRDRANKSHALFLQRIAKVKAGDIAKEMGISDSSLSEIKNKQVENALLLLAHLGLKVVPIEFRCVEPATFEFMTVSVQKMMTASPQLLWDEGDA